MTEPTLDAIVESIVELDPYGQAHCGSLPTSTRPQRRTVAAKKALPNKYRVVMVHPSRPTVDVEATSMAVNHRGDLLFGEQRTVSEYSGSLIACFKSGSWLEAGRFGEQPEGA